MRLNNSRKSKQKSSTASAATPVRSDPASATSPAIAVKPANPGWIPLLCLVLIALNLYVYAPVRSYPFVNFDDASFVEGNSMVKHGLTGDGLRWAMTAETVSNWHPLTMMSHMLDVQLYGMNAGMHHTTNVVFHTANTLLLFLVLLFMTGKTGRSVVVAALFGVHPLHVESVAWIAERKDVLSTFFGLLTLLAYVAYVRKPGWRRYLPVVVALALGLMAKPMLVTLPVILLLLDFWPLDRKLPMKRLVLEKLPLFALSVASSVVTLVVQRRGGSVIQLIDIPFTGRLANALASSIAYVGKMFWPGDLAVFYPFRTDVSWMVSGAAALVLIATTAAVLRFARTRPYLAVGWFWYGITLLPVIGLVQVGVQAMADRYTYIPSVGVFVAVVWTVSELLDRMPNGKTMATVAAALVIGLFAVEARSQVHYWKDSETLWRHTLDVTTDNFMAQGNLAFTLQQDGRVDEALQHYREALRLNPRSPEAHNGLGAILGDRMQLDEAVSHLSTALQLRPNYPEAYYNLGTVLLRQGQVSEAESYLLKAIELKSDYADAHSNYGYLLSLKGRTDEAQAHYRSALDADRDHVGAHSNLGILLIRMGKTEEGFAHLSEVVRLKPSNAQSHNNLAAALVEMGKPEEALREYNEALRLNPDYTDAHNHLGSLLMKLGRRDEANVQFQEAQKRLGNAATPPQ